LTVEVLDRHAARGARKLGLGDYIRLRKAKEAEMIWRTPEDASASLDELRIVTIMGQPPKDPNDDDDEDEEDDEEDEDEQEKEPAVIRDPDE
jgi:hypothetical protein